MQDEEAFESWDVPQKTNMVHEARE
jgi:hypothetical protein